MSPDEQQQAARFALLRLMSEISEDRWRAGWLSNLEFYLWEQVLEYRRDPSMPDAPPGFRGAARELAFLSEAAGGWWMWSAEHLTEVFVPLAEWERIWHEHQEHKKQG